MEKLKDENIHLEYKTAKKTLPKAFWETYSAFANTSGGTIVLGVSEDEKYNYRVVGVEDPKKIKTDLLTQLSDPYKISCNLVSEEDITIESVQGKKIMSIYVRPANYNVKPVYINNQIQRSYLRIGDGDHVAGSAELRYMISNSTDHIDTELLDNYTIDDLNLDDVIAYRELLIKNTGKESYKHLEYADFLYDIGAIKIDRSDNKKIKKLTVGCLLFFGKYNSILDKFPGFQLDYFKKNSSLQTDWTDRVSSGDMNFPEMNIFSFYHRTLNKLTESIPDKFIQNEDLTRGSYYSDLVIALKEALVNSLMHAYYSTDTPISIFAYDDFYEFKNPGDMRVSKDEFIHGNNPITRNSVISILFRKVGIAERAGSGGPRIFETAEKNHLRTPDIIKGLESTTIRIWKIDLFESLKDLSESEKDIVKFSLRYPIFSIKNITEKTKISDYKARNTVKDLTERGVLEKHGNGKSTKYTLSQTEETGIFTIKRMLKNFEDQMNK